jgi:hypothetical protein
MAIDILDHISDTKADDDRKTRVALFQKREIRHTMHHDEWWFVITDVIAALTDSPDPSGYWKKCANGIRTWAKTSKGGANLSPPLPWSLRRPAGLRKCSAGTQQGKQLGRRRTKKLKADED